jgi:hypothetical protein
VKDLRLHHRYDRREQMRAGFSVVHPARLPDTAGQDAM